MTALPGVRFPMSCFIIKTSAALLAGALCLACGTPPTVASKNAPQASTPGSQGDLRLKAPDGWVSERPSSSMRVSQYQLPAAEGDYEVHQVRRVQGVSSPAD